MSSVFDNGESPSGRPVQLWAKLQEESKLHQSALEREKQLQLKLSTLLKQQNQTKQRDKESPQIIADLQQEIKTKDQQLSLKGKELNQCQLKNTDLNKQLHVIEAKLKVLEDELIKSNNHARELEEACKERIRAHEELIFKKNSELEAQEQKLKQIEILQNKVKELDTALQDKRKEYEGGQILMQEKMQEKQMDLQTEATKNTENLQNKINELESDLKEKEMEFEKNIVLMQEEMEQKCKEFQTEEDKQIDELEKELDAKDAQMVEKEKECTDLKTFIEGQMQQKYEESHEIEYLKKLMAEQTLELNIQDQALTKQDDFIQELQQCVMDLENQMKREKFEAEENQREAVESQLQQLEKLQQEQLDLLQQQLEKQNLMLQQQDLRLHQQDQLIETINNKNIFVSWGIK